MNYNKNKSNQGNKIALQKRIFISIYNVDYNYIQNRINRNTK